MRRASAWCVPITTLGLLLAVSGNAGATTGTPPPSSSPSSTTSQTPVTTLPPVITTPAGTGASRLTLDSQPAWVALGGQLPLGLRIEGPVTDDMTLNVIAHRSIDSRLGYEAAMRGESLPAISGQRITVPVELASPDVNGVRRYTFTVQARNAPRDQNQLLLPLSDPPAGVFPVEVELRDGADNRLSSFITPVVAVASEPAGVPAIAQRLKLAWVFPMAAQPALLSDGSPDPQVIAELDRNGAVGGTALALQNHGVPVTVAPGPETLEAWAAFAATVPDLDLASTWDAFRGLLGSAQMLGGPYVPIDVPSLTSGGFSAEVGTELRKGTETLQSVLGVQPDVGTAVVRPIDEQAVGRLRDEGVTRVIVDERALVPREERLGLTPANPFQLRSEARSVPAVASNTGLSRLLEGRDPPALRAQRFLAALSVIAIEQPGLTRGVVVLNRERAPLDLAALNAALAGLGTSNPLVEAVPVRDLFDTVPRATDPQNGEPIERALVPIDPASPPVTPQQYDATRDALTGYRNLLTVPSPLVVQGDRALLVSLSSEWKGQAGRDRARTELDTVTSQISQFMGAIHVPVNPTITLTSRKAEIPVTFLNETDQTIRVRVGLASDDLAFPDGPFHDVELPPQNTTLRFAIEARGSGTFPLTLTVTSPDGSLQLQQTEVQVRSTFVSNVGVFLTVGAILFLALWWGNDFRRRRRRRAAATAPEPGAGDASPDAAVPGAPR